MVLVHGWYTDMRLVFVEWLDSYGCSSTWQSIENCNPQAMVCYSVGWLLHDGKDCKVIVPHITDPNSNVVNRQGCGDMTIPVRAILRLVDLPAADLLEFRPEAGRRVLSG